MSRNPKITLEGNVLAISNGEAYVEIPDGMIRVRFLDEIKTWSLRNKKLKIVIEIEGEQDAKDI